MMFQRDSLKKENEGLREALEFYANKDTYKNNVPIYIRGEFYDFELEIIADNGTIARLALEGEKK